MKNLCFLYLYSGLLLPGMLSCKDSSKHAPTPAPSPSVPVETSPSKSAEVQPIHSPAQIPLPEGISHSMARIPQDLPALDAAVPEPLPNAWNFNVLAWRSFLSLNWPADPATCGPDETASITGDSESLRVWQSYLRDTDVLLDSNQVIGPADTPSPWCPSGPRDRLRFSRLPKAKAKEAGAFAEKHATTYWLPKTTKMGGMKEAPGLIDQHGRLVRYETLLNRDIYDFLMKPDEAHPEANLWSQRGQDVFFEKNPSVSALSLPAGKAGGKVGALSIQAAWKVLDEAEIKAKRYFMVQNAMVDTGGLGMQQVTLGLLGMHIAHKTETAPQWVWATFEHVDNILSPAGGGGALNSAACPQSPVYTYPLPEAACTSACCPPNTPVENSSRGMKELDTKGKAVHPPVQVVRVQEPIDVDLRWINDTFQRLLAGTVWANYRLIGTQWPLEPRKDGQLKGPNEDVKPQPPTLANVAFETFWQGPPATEDAPSGYPYSLGKSAALSPFSQGVRASCLPCHSVAAVGRNRDHYADFLMLLANAR